MWSSEYRVKMDVNLSNKIKVLLNKNFTENGLVKNVFIKCDYSLWQRLIIQSSGL